MEKKALAKKIVHITANVLLYLFLALAIVAVVLTVTAKRSDDGTITLFGMQMRRVTSPSMAECDKTDVSDFEIGSIPVNSMVFVETVPEDEKEAEKWYASLREGDVLTFRYCYETQVTITHRIIDIEEKQGGFVFTLQGDNKNDDEGVLQQKIDTTDKSVDGQLNYIIGKVTGQSYFLGFLVSLLSNPLGIVLIIIVPCSIVILLEIIRIISVVNSDKKKRIKEEQIKKDTEIEELRRQLASLQQNSQNNGQSGSGDTQNASNEEKNDLDEKKEEDQKE